SRPARSGRTERPCSTPCSRCTEPRRRARRGGRPSWRPATARSRRPGGRCRQRRRRARAPRYEARTPGLPCNHMVAQMDVTYEVDGTTMVGRLARPDRDGRRPGVLIAHEGNGLDDVQKARPARFAELGYVAFALDYHGGGRPLEDRAAINARLKALGDHPGRTRRIARAGLDILRRENPTKVAAVGYCFGGTLVLELGRSGADLAAIVGFHPGLTTKRPEDSVHIRGPVLMCVGADDPLIRVEQRLAFEAEMRAAG